jgi:hypothetical protein
LRVLVYVQLAPVLDAGRARRAVVPVAPAWGGRSAGRQTLRGGRRRRGSVAGPRQRQRDGPECDVAGREIGRDGVRTAAGGVSLGGPSALDSPWNVWNFATLCHAGARLSPRTGPLRHRLRGGGPIRRSSGAALHTVRGVGTLQPPGKCVTFPVSRCRGGRPAPARRPGETKQSVASAEAALLQPASCGARLRG